LKLSIVQQGENFFVSEAIQTIDPKLRNWWSNLIVYVIEMRLWKMVQNQRKQIKKNYPNTTIKI